MLELVNWTNSRLSLDIGARYLFGGEVNYLVPGPLRFGGEVADLPVNQSRTDVFTLYGGIVFEF